ncbi:MAG: amidohydrolase, partial [Rhodospirillaceae bacterium]|nr:amidohydrolase [Rhodospirillaceae bacterium]
MKSDQADQIWFNGKLMTMDPYFPYAEALAVRGGQILAVGTNEDVLNLMGPGTVKYNLFGKFIMPGIIESHTHALWGACRDLFDIYVGYNASFDDLIHATKERVQKIVPGEVVFGGPWRLDMRQQMGSNPREVLDQISCIHPIILQDTSQHILWCNTLAMRLGGISKDASDIAGGVIERDCSTGEPNGILAEAAGNGPRQLNKRTSEQLETASRTFNKYFNSLGITSFKEPMALEADMFAYKAADDRGDLTLHMAAHLVREGPLIVEAIPYDKLEEMRSRFSNGNIRASFAKLFLDGVAPGHTASFVEPYLASSGYDLASHDPDSTLLITPEELNKTVTELDRRGFVTKMHAVGDNAIRKGLDAIEVARHVNGNYTLRHEIAHSVFVADQDLSRFKQLNAVAEVSPKLWFPNAATSAQIQVLGKDRLKKSHRIRDLLEASAELTYASDWPASAPDANPWTGLAGMLSRQDALGYFEGTIASDQAISLSQALPLFTINGARSLGMEHETGSLNAGKWADFIVLTNDLTMQAWQEIGLTKVETTVWKGCIVYSN